MFIAPTRPNRPRRGVTLVEMLVVVALVVLMMTILVQIFQSATGAMTASRTTQELDVVLRQVDSMIRFDLIGITAKMTPPNDPANKSGYFEYIENSPADAQGEDTDDGLAFTTKAPEGRVFTGRQWLSKFVDVGGKPVQTINQSIQPITINSQVAEVIYFLRNGNLYRRVFLVAPDRAKSMTQGFNGSGTAYPSTKFGTSSGSVSWQGVNDISSRPRGYQLGSTSVTPIPNDLGDLTNREKRAFRPRFFNDFNLDGIPDDFNNDGIPDYYPTLYYNGGNGNVRTDSTGNAIDYVPNTSISPSEMPFPNNAFRKSTNPYDIYPFPFIYPGMYSIPDGATVDLKTMVVTPPTTNLGWRHGLFPGIDPTSKLALANHGWLDIGDNLPAPSTPQTWFGFPTWRESLTAFVSTTQGWSDPILSVNTNRNKQSLGLTPFPPDSSKTYSLNDARFPTPLRQNGTGNPPPFTDGAGSASFMDPVSPLRIWEDDLILTNVRSFDVKAYDINAPLYNFQDPKSLAFVNGPFSAGYQDLGYGVESGYGSAVYAFGPNGPSPAGQTAVPFQAAGENPIGFGHAGRIPALTSDFRPHPRRGYNIGDDNAGVIRLNRVWDSWSTDYTNAPDSDVLLNGYSSTSQAIYPSFPPPYSSPLRGIQIQIRVVDPRNERSKVLTIRHDFTDKL